MQHIKAPEEIPRLGRMLFLAGSIEMGAAEKWQDRVVEELKDSDWVVLNPRRDDWDSSWEQTIANDKFREQVEWELECLEKADKILVVFDPNTKSPITLLELGFLAGYRDPSKVIVVCPEGFWRKGNVDVVCARYNIPQCSTLEDAFKLV